MQSLRGVEDTRRVSFDDVLERETSFAYMRGGGGRGVKSRVESRVREDLSFSDYESFPLYLDSH